MAKVTLIVVALFLVVAAAWCAPAEPQPAAAQDKEELQPAEKDDLKPAASHWGGHHGGWGGHYGGWGGHYGGYYPYYGSYWSWPYSYYWPHGGYGGYGGYGHHGYWW